MTQTEVKPHHSAVMVEEVLMLLEPETGGVYVDATLGEGGHAEAILGCGEQDVKVIGIDIDSQILKVARKRLARFGTRAKIIKGNFSELPRIVYEAGLKYVDGIILDVGVSSFHLEKPERGFSFMRSGPLDMRFDPDKDISLAELLETLSTTELETVIRKEGEERYARRISTRIKDNLHKITTTTMLAEEIKKVIPIVAHERPHPATRTFMSLRRALNKEGENLERFLMSFHKVLSVGGSVVVITYNSLEDRVVKHYFREFVKREGENVFVLLTKRPVTPSELEQRTNPRSRSAKLRAIRRVA